MSTVTQETVRLTDLSVDQTVQRVEGLDRRRVNDMAKVFDPALLGTITLSLREDGSMIVLDGWHRTEAAKVAGYEGDLFAVAYSGLTREQEMIIFVGLNASKQVSAVTKFVMRVGSGDDTANALNNVLQSHGWRVAAGSGEGVFSAVVALEQVFTTGSKILPAGEYLDLVNRTIRVITAAYGHDSAAMNALIVKGVAKVIAVYGDKLSEKDLALSLAKFPPKNLISRIRGTADMQGTSVEETAAFIMVVNYNHGKRTQGIDPWLWRK